MMDELKSLLDTMRLENKQNFASISQQIQIITTEITELKTDVTDLKLSLDFVDNEVRVIKDETVPELRSKLMSEIEALRKQRLEAELYSKKSNLLIYGIQQRGDEDCESVIRNFLKVELKHERAETMLFANCHRLPSKRGNQAHPDPIIVKFIQMKDRDSVLRLAYRLKNSTSKFGISPHLPKEMQQRRQQLLPIKKQATAAGKKAVLKTVGTEVKLFIDNKLYVSKPAASASAVSAFD
jgi:hypothetical protein